MAVAFASTTTTGGATIRVITGQYLGFTVILAVSIAGEFLRATLRPPALLPCFGLLPMELGLRAAWLARRQNRGGKPSDTETQTSVRSSEPAELRPDRHHRWQHPWRVGLEPWRAGGRSGRREPNLDAPPT